MVTDMMKGLPWHFGISVILTMMACSVDISPALCFLCGCVEIFLDYKIRLETGISDGDLVSLDTIIL